MIDAKKPIKIVEVYDEPTDFNQKMHATAPVIVASDIIRHITNSALLITGLNP